MQRNSPAPRLLEVLLLALGLACGSGGGGGGPATHTLRAAVSGLTGAGLALGVSTGGGAAATVPVPASGEVALASGLRAGTSYAVAVLTQPTGPDQTCAVTGGSGTVGSADVTVEVACGAPVPTFAVGGTVSGLVGAGLVLVVNGGGDLSVSAPGAFTFATRIPQGSAYAVTVKSHPAGQACAVAGGSGTVNADVTGVQVTCADVPAPLQAWSAPTSWGARWAATATMRQHAWFDGSGLVEDPALGGSRSWSPPSTGAPPQVAFDGFPSGRRHGAGPFTGQPYTASATIDAGVASIPRDLIVCAVVKPDHDPRRGLSSEKGILVKGSSAPDAIEPAAGGGWVLHQMHEQFCFHYEYTGGNCPASSSCMQMVYTASFLPIDFDSSRPQPLNPSYVVFCAGRDGGTLRAAVNDIGGVPGLVREQTVGIGAVLDASSSLLTLGGYPTGEASHAFHGRIYETAVWAESATVANLQAKLAAVLGLGVGEHYLRNHEAPFLGADGLLHTAWRNGPRLDAARGMLFGLQGWNRLSSTTRHDNGASQDEFRPWNIIIPGEDLSFSGAGGWTPSASYLDDPLVQVAPPGDAGPLASDGGQRPTVPRVTLPAGASLTATLDAFAAAGPIQAGMWIRPVTSSGRLAVTAGGTSVTVDLGHYPPEVWSWVRLPGLAASTNAAGLPVRLTAQGTSIQFHLWGLYLTQLAGGGDAGSFDPGPLGYDWSASRDASTETNVYPAYPALDPRYPVDALQLAPPGAGTGTNGFCLAARARPFDGANPASTGLAWDAPLNHARTVLSWLSDAAATPPAQPARARLYVNGAGDPTTAGAPRQLCFEVSAAGNPDSATRRVACGAVPASFTPGSEHRLAGCVSQSGEVRVFADDVTVGGPVAGAPVLDLAGGHLVVGNAVPYSTWGRAAADPGDISRPWHGYVARAAACVYPPGGIDYVAGCR